MVYKSPGLLTQKNKSIHLHSAARHLHTKTLCLLYLRVVFRTPPVQPSRNKCCQVTLVFSQLLISTQHAPPFTQAAITSVWKVPQQDQCPPPLQKNLDLLLHQHARANAPDACNCVYIQVSVPRVGHMLGFVCMRVITNLPPRERACGPLV